MVYRPGRVSILKHYTNVLLHLLHLLQHNTLEVEGILCVAQGCLRRLGDNLRPLNI